MKKSSNEDVKLKRVESEEELILGEGISNASFEALGKWLNENPNGYESDISEDKSSRSSAIDKKPASKAEAVNDSRNKDPSLKTRSR
jgi:hypothetical protein